MTFLILGSIFGAALIGMGVFGYAVLPRKPEIWQKLPREKYVGSVLGIAALICSAILVTPLFEGDLARLRPIVWVLVPVIGVGSILYLEYLFSRAFGGFLLIAINYLMQQAFAAHAPFRWVLSIICYVIGIAALFMIGSPWRFRDLLKKMTDKENYRYGISAGLVIGGLISLLIAVGSHG